MIEVGFAGEVPQGWAIAAAFRGFVGHRIDTIPPPIGEALLSVFHEQHDRPAPFRMQVCERPERNRVIVELQLLGDTAVTLLPYLEEAIDGGDGELGLNNRAHRFAVSAIRAEPPMVLRLPQAAAHPLGSKESAFLRDLTAFERIRVQSASPFFSKADAETVFSSGKWTQLLAIRFADLAGIPRKSVQSLAKLLPVPSEVTRMDSRISFGGSNLPRSGWQFSITLQRPSANLLLWLRLLVLLGLGRHTAFGAGSFEILIPEGNDH